MATRSDHSSFLTGAPMRKPKELDRVSLREPVSHGEDVYPAGAEGTVVHRYKDGAAFEVEFARPVAGVITVEASQIEVAPKRASGQSRSA
jgi:hypothetical protein